MKKKTIEKLRALYFYGILLTCIILLVTMASAENNIQSLGTYKLNDPVNLVQNCINSTYSNITRITYPNGTFAINIPTIMESNGFDYNYTFSDTNSLGTYLVYGTCDENGLQTNWVYDFVITVTGSDLDTSKSISYIIVFVISILIFIGLLFLGIMLPSKNDSDELTGYIIAVSNLKYFKLLCLAFSYVSLIVIFYLSWSFSYAYLDFEFLTRILQFIFYALAIVTLPLFIMGTYLTITNLIKDSKLSEMLSRGLHVK